MTREAGTRTTPVRDVRESLLGGDQTNLDMAQDLAIKRLERRDWLTQIVAWIALGFGVLSVTTALWPKPPVPAPVCPPHPALTCPPAVPCPRCPDVPACPTFTCPSSSRRH